MSSALLVAVLVAVLVGIQVSDSIATEAESFAEHDVPAYQLLLSIDRDGYETQLALRNLIAATDDETREAEYAAFIENRDQTASRFEEHKELTQRHEGEEALWPDYEETRATWSARVATADRVAPVAVGSAHRCPREWAVGGHPDDPCRTRRSGGAADRHVHTPSSSTVRVSGRGSTVMG